MPSKQKKSKKTKKKKKSKPNELILAHKSFREEYKKLLPRRKELFYNAFDKYSYKEVCFQHNILLMLQRHNLINDKMNLNAFGCQSTNCSIYKSLITNHELTKMYEISMKSLNLSFSTKNAAMSDLDLCINGKNHKIKLLKIMAGAIKRYTQPTTTKEVVCSSSFGETELFFLLSDDNEPFVIMSVGLRRDKGSDYMKVEITDNALIPNDVAPFWYQNWCVHGILEDVYSHKMDAFIAIHHNKFVGDIQANMERISICFYFDKRQKDKIRICVNDKLIDQYPGIDATKSEIKNNEVYNPVPETLDDMKQELAALCDGGDSIITMDQIAEMEKRHESHHQKAMNALSKYSNDNFNYNKMMDTSNKFGIAFGATEQCGFQFQTEEEIEKEIQKELEMINDEEKMDLDNDGYNDQMVAMQKIAQYQAQRRKIYNQALRGKKPINRNLWNLYFPNDAMMCSQNVQKLKDSMQGNEEWNIEHIDSEKYNAQKYKNAVVVYLELNENQKQNEEIVTFPNGQKCKNYEIMRLFQSAMPHKYISKLQGQFCVLAKQNIPCDTILCEVRGRMMMESEFESLFVESCQDYNMAHIDSFNLAVVDKKDESKRYRLVLNSNYLYYGVFQWSQYMNDPRVRFCGNGEFEMSDYAHWNVDFVTFYVNGWPRVFLVTKRDILKDEELMVYYNGLGDAFWRGKELEEIEHCSYKLRKLCEDDLPIPNVILMDKKEMINREIAPYNDNNVSETNMNDAAMSELPQSNGDGNANKKRKKKKSDKREMDASTDED